MGICQIQSGKEISGGELQIQDILENGEAQKYFPWVRAKNQTGGG